MESKKLIVLLIVVMITVGIIMVTSVAAEDKVRQVTGPVYLPGSPSKGGIADRSFEAGTPNPF